MVPAPVLYTTCSQIANIVSRVGNKNSVVVVAAIVVVEPRSAAMMLILIMMLLQV